MGKGGQNVSRSASLYKWSEVKEHTSKTDKWLVIKDQVYDISSWANKHPGGSRVISHFAGQDATEAFRAFHNDIDAVTKYMKPLHRGTLHDDASKNQEVKEDFDTLRDSAEKMGLFKPSIMFYVLSLGHILMFEVLAYLVFAYYGTGWIPFLVSLLFNTIVQAQTGWNQHDYGHLSVLKTSKLNHWFHLFTMNFIKGASADWWNHLHYQHHAKPNCLNKDPDVRLDAVFVVGEEMAKRTAEKKKSSMPYNWQHHYFFAIGPPLLFPVYFQFMIFRHTISRKKWLDLFIMCMFYMKFFTLYIPVLGLAGALGYYFLMRVMESHWFVWVAQSNHIPMNVDVDRERPWLALQLNATCNVEKSQFNDWFTGHLNFQIEHHLFPTMPRHNLYKIAPLVKSLCEKHNIPYVVKPLSTAFADIIRQLKHSGEIWHHYYHAYHLS